MWTKCEEYHFHVYCATGMVIEEFKKDQKEMIFLEGCNYESNNDNDNDDDRSGLAVALKNMEVPIEGRRNGGRRSGKKKLYIRIAKMFLRAFVGILLGDPTAPLVCLVVELLAK
ncbi:hypothetical protein Ddye_026562 [Dipteronia dyeriana]|uniref:Uncharacterized protein n=1 Tax=Dipteronia dyeriana TaxID=168575 RepID=A0AAD9TMD9_9ROSI|nr:hypothetical protein Ddye_026562 [Dipteronia dyeriana]